MAEKKRFVRNRTGGPVFLKGHGVIPSGSDPVEVAGSEKVDAAIEAGVLVASEAPKPSSANTADDNQKED